MDDDLWEALRVELHAMFRSYRARISALGIKEKPDKTILTDADVAIESTIVDLIRAIDPSAVFVAEEAGSSIRAGELPNRVWVIDPIDGTAEFVRPDRMEFCSVVCVLESRRPVASFVLAPELGPDRTPVVVTSSVPQGEVAINGVRVRGHDPKATTRWASVTRSRSVSPRAFEAAMMREGYRLKTRTTSQTLDMVRTAVDLSPTVGRATPRFDLFYRERQKIWDGLAGMCFGDTLGLAIRDNLGSPHLPVAVDTLLQEEPTFDATLMGAPETVEWLLTLGLR